MKLHAVATRKLYTQIADQIRGQILSGAVVAGQQLPSERDMAATLGVSRPTLREALIALEVAGLIEVRIGVGAFVRQPGGTSPALPETRHSPFETMAVRRLLEPQAAALAAAATDKAGADDLVRILAAMHADTAAGRWSADSDRALHLAIAERAGNGVLRDVLAGLWSGRDEAVDARFHQHLAGLASVREHILGDHAAVVAAILAGRPEDAREAMARHLEFVADAMTAAWE